MIVSPPYPDAGALAGTDAREAPSSFALATDAWVRKQRLELGIDPPEGGPSVILNTGHIEAIPPSPDLGEEIARDAVSYFHSDEYLFDPDTYSWPRPGVATACGAPFTAVAGCGCGLRVVRKHCDARPCSEEFCREKIRTRRSWRISAKLLAGLEGRAVLYGVFTVPPPRRSAAREKKTWKAWLDRLLRFMKKELGFDYGVERSDPCGEDGETWHPHFNLLWVRRHGFRPFLTPTEREALRAKWASIVWGGPTDNRVSIYLAYTTDRARIHHWCRYIGRTWPRWEEQFKYHLRIKWLGRAPKKPVEEADGDCKKCGLEVCRMSFGSVREAAEAAGWSYDRLRDHAELERFGRLAKFGRWRPINAASELD